MELGIPFLFVGWGETVEYTENRVIPSPVMGITIRMYILIVL